MAAAAPSSRPTLRTHRVTYAASQLKAMVGGSTRAHHDLVATCLSLAAIHGVAATPIATTGIPVRREDGAFALKKNPRQEGCSDIVLCLRPHGRMALVEVKTGKARRSPAQVRFHQRFEASGAICRVVRCAEDFLVLLQGAGRGEFLNAGGHA